MLQTISGIPIRERNADRSGKTCRDRASAGKKFRPPTGAASPGFAMPAMKTTVIARVVHFHSQPQPPSYSR
jgi:hypothetical protein